MEQTGGRSPGTQLSQCDRSRLKWTWRRLHYRYHSTGLLRLSRSAIQVLGNNIVLKERPIADVEQRLNRRQQCTLSQLRSGHCHILQDYKHRVFGEPSDICIDCGASPQSVRHLFACNAHPTDLSPEDLWRIRWDRLVRSATSMTGTFTDLMMDLVVANNNNICGWLSNYMRSQQSFTCWKGNECPCRTLSCHHHSFYITDIPMPIELV